MGTLLWALRFKMSFFLRITNMLIFSPCQNYSLPKVIGRWRLAVLSIFWLSETLHIIPFFGQKKWSVAVFFIHLGEAFKRWAASTSWSRRGFWFAWYIVCEEYHFHIHTRVTRQELNFFLISSHGITSADVWIGSIEALQYMDMSKRKDFNQYYVENTLLITLFVLHVYWWILIWRMLIRQLQNRGKVGEDVRSGSLTPHSITIQLVTGGSVFSVCCEANKCDDC